MEVLIWVQEHLHISILMIMKELEGKLSKLYNFVQICLSTLQFCQYCPFSSNVNFIQCLSILSNFSDFVQRCLKITEKVSFNIVSDSEQRLHFEWRKVNQKCQK